MSVLYTEDDCTLISHKEYIDRIYSASVDTSDDVDLQKTYALREVLFDFNAHNQNDHDDQKRHRKINDRKNQTCISKNPELHKLVNLWQKCEENVQQNLTKSLNFQNQNIASKTKDFLDNCRRKHFFTHQTDNHSLSMVNEVSSEKAGLTVPVNGRNTLDTSILTNISGETYLIPPNCKFSNSCVSEIEKFADELYDFVVIDPPWWNKYIRRVRNVNRNQGYDMMYNEDILAIPLENLVHPNTIVAIWCTNSPTHSEFIKNIALPKWNLKLLTTYYWVKITKSGDPVCEFNVPLKKQPYEQLFLAAHMESEMVSKNDVINLMLSIPSVVHSHKPPLLDIFKDYLPAEPKCLEIFARYLLPHFTSIGREVLKLQNTALFEEKTSA